MRGTATGDGVDCCWAGRASTSKKGTHGKAGRHGIRSCLCTSFAGAGAAVEGSKRASEGGTRK